MSMVGQKSFEDLLNDNERLHMAIASLEADKVRLSEELETLTSLCVASHQLHASLDRERILLAIQEVMINLVGCERFAIFELDSDNSDNHAGGEHLSLIASKGVDPKRCTIMVARSRMVARVMARAARGERYVAADEGTEPEEESDNGMIACIPLKAGGTVLGMITAFRLLDHKRRLHPSDHQLFELLAAQAGKALYCARLHAARKAL